MKTSRTRQAGFTFPLFVIAIGSLAFAIFVGYGMVASKKITNAYRFSQQGYLDDCRKRIGQWYAANLKLEATPGWTLDSEKLLELAGIQRSYALVAIVSPALNDGTVQYHKFALISPDTKATSAGGAQYGAYDANGVLSVKPGFRYVEFDGKDAQYVAMAATNKSLERLANLLEQYTASKVSLKADADGATNLFLPVGGCGHLAAGEFPCTNGDMTAAEFIAFKSVLGSGAALTTQSAWGTDIFVNNNVDANSSEPPYTMTVSAKTPWNTTLAVKAVQPLY